MKPTNIYNHNEERKNRYECEKNDGISLTVPNQSATIREILSRTGVATIGKPVSYDDEPSHDAIDVTSKLGFDIVEADERLQEFAIREAEQKAKAKQKAKEDKQRANDEAKKLAEQKTAEQNKANENSPK